MSGPALRVALVTLGLVVAIVGLSIAIVGVLPSTDETLLGIPPGVPQVLLGGAFVVAGILFGRVGWEMTPFDEEEE